LLLFFPSTSTPATYTLSLHDALPISFCGLNTDNTLTCWNLTPPTGTFIEVSAGGSDACGLRMDGTLQCWGDNTYGQATPPPGPRSEEHTSELQSRFDLVCRLLLEKKK